MRDEEVTAAPLARSVLGFNEGARRRQRAQGINPDKAWVSTQQPCGLWVLHKASQDQSVNRGLSERNNSGSKGWSNATSGVTPMWASHPLSVLASHWPQAVVWLLSPPSHPFIHPPPPPVWASDRAVCVSGVRTSVNVIQLIQMPPKVSCRLTACPSDGSLPFILCEELLRPLAELTA